MPLLLPTSPKLWNALWPLISPDAKLDNPALTVVKPSSEPNSFQVTTVTYKELLQATAAAVRTLHPHVDSQQPRPSFILYGNQPILLTISAMLAAVRLGAPFIWVDSPERLATILADNSLSEQHPIKVIVGEAEDIQGLSTHLPICSRFEEVSSDSDVSTFLNPVISAEGEEDLDAYCVSTSGTTGTPRTLILPGDGLLKWQTPWQEVLKLAPKKAYLVFASPIFDAAFWDMFGALFNGAHIVTASTSIKADTASLLPLLNGTLYDKETDTKSPAIDVLTVPPSIYQLIAELVPHSDKSSSSAQQFLDHPVTITSTGGAFRPEFTTKLLAAGSRPVNGYGPSEVSVGATLNPIHEAHLKSIGHPINAMSFLLKKLDTEDTTFLSLAAAESNVSYELYIGGRGLGRYTDPTLNEERFKEIDGKRYFATGDYVTLTPTGEINFVSRQTRVVKVSGQKVELDTIETTLKTIDGITNAAVTTLPSGKIVAFITQRDTPTPTPSIVSEALLHTLREQCKSLMSRWAIPSFFVTVPLIPTKGEKRTPDYAQLTMPDFATEPLPQNLSENRRALLTTITSILNLKEITPEALWAHKRSTLQDLGLDSLGRTTLQGALRNQGISFEISLEDSVQTLCLKIVTATYVKRFSLPSEKKSILVFPDITGTTEYFTTCQKTNNIAPTTIISLDVAANDELALTELMPLLANFEDLVQFYTYVYEQLRITHLNAPHMVVGYSLGACIAMGVMAKIADAGRTPPPTVLLDPLVIQTADELNAMLPTMIPVCCAAQGVVVPAQNRSYSTSSSAAALPHDIIVHHWKDIRESQPILCDFLAHLMTLAAALPLDQLTLAYKKLTKANLPVSFLVDEHNPLVAKECFYTGSPSFNGCKPLSDTSHSAIITHPSFYAAISTYVQRIDTVPIPKGDLVKLQAAMALLESLCQGDAISITQSAKGEGTPPPPTRNALLTLRNSIFAVLSSSPPLIPQDAATSSSPSSPVDLPDSRPCSSHFSTSSAISTAPTAIILDPPRRRSLSGGSLLFPSTAADSTHSGPETAPGTTVIVVSYASTSGGPIDTPAPSQ